MATRAKQLQADLRAARKEVAQLQARCTELEEDNAKLKQEHMENYPFHSPTETEEQVGRRA